MAVGNTTLAVIAGGYLAAAGLTAWLAVYTYRSHREKRIGVIFAALVASFTVWTLGELATLSTTDPTPYVVLASGKYLGVVTAPVLFFMFALVYADGGHLVTRRTTAALFVVPAITLVAIATNPVHGLYYTSFTITTVGDLVVLATTRGPASYAFVVYGYGLLVLGSALLIYGAIRKPAFYRVQVASVLLGIGVAWAVSIAYVLAGWPHPGLDTTPFGFAAASMFFAVGIFGASLIDVAPAAWARVADSIPDVVVVLDTDDRIVNVNAAAVALFGDGLIGRPATETLPSAFHPAADADGDDAAPAGNETGDLIEYRHDGRPRFYERQVVPLGTVGEYGRVMICRDVTDQVLAERELQDRNDRLQEMTSVAAHDLRNPLNVIQGYAELLAETNQGEEIDHIQAAADRMYDLVEDILVLGRTFHQDREPEVLPLETVVTDAWQTCRTSDATLEIVDDLPAVTAHERSLRQLFENLIRNAVEHCGEDVTVRVGRLPDEQGFYIADDGPGIPPDQREAVFDYGFTSTSDGSGFGLAIVQNIASSYGWTVVATQAATGGARFEVRTDRSDIHRFRDTNEADAPT